MSENLTDHFARTKFTDPLIQEAADAFGAVPQNYYDEKIFDACVKFAMNCAPRNPLRSP